MPFTSFPSSQPWLHPRRPERRGGWGAPDSGFPPGSCSGWWGRELATSRGSSGAGAARWALGLPGGPGATPPRVQRAPGLGVLVSRLPGGSGLARGAAGKCGVASIAQPVRSGDLGRVWRADALNATVTGCRTGSEGGGGYSGTLGAKVGGKKGRLWRAGLTAGGGGREQRSSCGRDGCRLRSCHLESDRRRLL